MKTVPLSEAKARLRILLDAVQGRDEEIVITRNGRADANLVAEIRRGLSALKPGKSKLYILDELFTD